MKEKLKQYLNNACSQAAKTQKNQELQEEILANLYEKYDDFLIQGMSAEEAYRKTVENIGDLSSLFEAKPEAESSVPHSAPPSNSNEPPKYQSESTQPKEKKKPLAQVIFAVAAGIFWALVCIAYFGYSFYTGNWATSWLIFVHGALLYGIAHGIFSLVIGKRRVGSIIKIVICSILLAILFGSNILISNYDWQFSLGSSSLVYDDDHYEVGNVDLPADTEIRNLDIEWLEGDVTVCYWDETYVSVQETSKQTLERSRQLRYYVSGNSLSIKAQGSHFILFSDLPAKSLTVYLPQETQLNQLTVSGVAASICIEELTATDAELTTVSGSMELLDVTLQDLHIDTVSGNITWNGEAAEMEIDTVSGELRFELYNTPRSIEIDSVSASATLTLPAEIAGYSVEFDSVSGICKLPDQSHIRDDDYEYGDGATDIAFDSVSGNLTILHP